MGAYSCGSRSVNTRPTPPPPWPWPARDSRHRDDHPSFHPASEGGEELAIIDGSGGPINTSEPPGFVARDVELEAIPPAHAVLGLTCLLPKGTVLTPPTILLNVP